MYLRLVQHKQVGLVINTLHGERSYNSQVKPKLD